MSSSKIWVVKEEFPYKEMAILSTAVFASGISLSGIFPYVGFMVIWLGLAKTEDEAGYYSGFIASAMMFGRLISSFWWGQKADIWGRKPVLLIGCCSVSICSLLFGISTTFPMALLARVLLGMFNPIWGTAKTLCSELCCKKHEASAMGLTTGCWSLGLVFGPAFGGMLSNPATVYHNIFGSYQIFINYPYLLPNIVTAFFGFLGAFCIFFFFPETLPINDTKIIPHSTNNIINNNDNSIIINNDDNEIMVKEKEIVRGASLSELYYTPGVYQGLWCYFVLSFNSIVFDEVVPLWAMATHIKGGLEFEEYQIGTLMSITGFFLVLYTIFIYPKLSAYLGRKNGFRVSQALAAPFIFSITILNKLDSSSPYKFPALVFFYGSAKALNSLGFASCALILNNCVEAEKRASLNGLSMSFGSMSKSVGPFLGSLAFAWSVNNKFNYFPLDFHFVFVLVSISSLGASLMNIPDDKNSIIKTSPSNDIELGSYKLAQNNDIDDDADDDDNNIRGFKDDKIDDSLLYKK